MPAGARGIVIDLNGATLMQDIDAYTIGAAYPLYNTPERRHLVLPMRGTPRRGDTAVELTPGTPPPRPGTLVMLAAGNTVERYWSPVAEMQIVTEVNGAAVHFDRPLAKSYHPFGKAWFGGAMPYGLFDLTDLHARDIALVGPGRIVNDWRAAGYFPQVLGMRMAGVTCEGRAGMILRGRDLAVEDCLATIRADWNPRLYRPMNLAFDTGSSHVRVRNFTATAQEGMSFLHLHEALADVDIRGLRIVNTRTFDPRAEHPGAIDIRAGSWNVTIDGAHLTNNPQGAGITAIASELGAGGNRNLTLKNVVIDGDFLQYPVIVKDTDTVVIEGFDVSRATYRTPRHGKTKLNLLGPHIRASEVTGDGPA